MQRWVDRRTDRQTDTEMDGRTDRPGRSQGWKGGRERERRQTDIQKEMPGRGGKEGGSLQFYAIKIFV